MPEDNFHPVANIFPLLEGADLQALVEDIKSHGLREAIWRHRDGRILDGRNRWRACHAASVACPSRTFKGDDSEILAFVISQNLHRRHLDASQRAMIAAELANLGEGRPSKTPSFDGVSTEQAAKLMNVGEKSVERAKAVRRDAVPEVVRAVEQGQLSVSRAVVIARAESARQRRIVAGEEPVAHLVPKPERRPDDVVRRTVKVTYWEPEEPTVVRVSAYVTDTKPEPQRDLTRMATERSAVPAELNGIRIALQASMGLSPEQAAAALPADRRDEFIRLAQRRQAWLVEFLRLLGAGIDQDGRHCDLSRAE
jgi:hypothetical protein